VVDYLCESIVVGSINCAVLDAETRCRRAISGAARARQRLVRELAMTCPPLTVYGPACTTAADALPVAQPTASKH